MYDYVIVGAGSAGCVLANRLSANPNNRVLLLEAGGRDWNPFIHMPAGLSRLVKHRAVNWNYNTTPQSELHDRELYWPRGKVLGGSSSINAMCYIRGQAEDYDAWEALGNPGWGYHDVLPYFLKSEDNSRGASHYHGVGGPLSVSDLRHTNKLSHAFINAGTQLGLAANPDFNGARQEGFGFYQVTQRNGRRCSTAVGYLDPVRERDNLTILVRARARELLWDGQQRIRGIRYRHQGRDHEVSAGEVLLSGGAINSPHLLMLSGIGSGYQLRQHDIPIRHELPGVGANLQDHLDVCVLQRCTRPITYDQPNEIAIGLNYWVTHGGVGSSNVAEAGAFIASELSEDGRPDIQLHFVPAQLDDHGRNRLPGYGYTMHACYLRPHSRGEIRLQSANPDQAPLMDPRYLSEPFDIEAMLVATRTAREVLAAPAFDEYRGPEILPGRKARSDADLLTFIRTKAETIYHPVGTCKMGQDNMAVVDHQLKVHGLEGLRVIDASIMPKLISGNTNGPTVMLAEKIADTLLNTVTLPHAHAA